MTQTAHQPLDLGEVRRQLRLAIEETKRAAAAHRSEVDEAGKSFDFILEHVAAPLFRQFTSALRAEGLLFRVITPTGAVRIEAERSADNYLELVLDIVQAPRRGAAAPRLHARPPHLHRRPGDRRRRRLLRRHARAVALGADGRGRAVHRALTVPLDVTVYTGST